MFWQFLWVGFIIAESIFIQQLNITFLHFQHIPYMISAYQAQVFQNSQLLLADILTQVVRV